MWLGELITEKNIGNGVSIIIFAGIVARLPVVISNFAAKVAGGTVSGGDMPIYLILLIVAVGAVAAGACGGLLWSGIGSLLPGGQWRTTIGAYNPNYAPPVLR